MIHYRDSNLDTVFPGKNDSEPVQIVKYYRGSKHYVFHCDSVFSMKGSFGKSSEPYRPKYSLVMQVRFCKVRWSHGKAALEKAHRVRCCFAPPSGRNRQGHSQSMFCRFFPCSQSMLVDFSSFSVNFSRFFHQISVNFSKF